MPSVEEHAAVPREARLARLALTARQLHDLVRASDSASLALRPAADAWAPVEVICHLRDSEEWFSVRCRMVREMEEPPFPRNNPDRWARERQYLRHDAGDAIAAFGVFATRCSNCFVGFEPMTGFEAGCISTGGGGGRSTSSCPSWPGTTTTISTSSGVRSPANRSPAEPGLYGGGVIP